MKSIAELRAEAEKVLAEADALTAALGEGKVAADKVAESTKAANEKYAQVEALTEQIKLVERQTKAQAFAKKPASELPLPGKIEAGKAAGSEAEPSPQMAEVKMGWTDFDSKTGKRNFAQVKYADRGGPFMSFGEQLIAIMNFTRSHDSAAGEKLYSVKALGSGEDILSEGGFLLQAIFTNEIFSRAYATGELASRCRHVPISSPSNGLLINMIDETSRATGSRWGGIQSYWLAAGATGTGSKPKFRQVELRLKKLAGYHYATDEELQDVAALESIISQAFVEDMAWMIDDAIMNGNGAGLPLGLLQSPSLVTVAKEVGQAASTVSQENISKMWSRCWAKSRPNACWFISQDVEPQLDQLAVATGLSGWPAYMPPGGIADAPFGRLKGRPVVITENCQALGTVGDIVLADLSQYILADKGGLQMATSMHVQFLTDETCFRFIYRVDGSPAWNAPLTPARGSNTLSPFVALATRA